MVIYAYKLPNTLNIEEFIQAISEVEAPINIFPVQDINGDWFISKEEWELPEWQDFKTLYNHISVNIILTEFIHKELNN